MDNQGTKLLESWKMLTGKEKETILFHVQFLLEKHRPDYQKKVATEEEDHRSRMVRVRDIKGRLDKVAMNTRHTLYSALPGNDLQMLLIDFELLSFLTFAAEYKPYYFYEQNEAAFTLARKTIPRVLRRLAKLQKGQV